MKRHKEKRFYKKSFLLLALIITLTTVFVCKESKKISADEGYYTCSMHPQVIKQEPGNCPICGMRLVFQSSGKSSKDHSKHKKTNDKTEMKMEEAEVGETNYFKFNLAQSLLANANITTVPVKKEKFVRKSSYSGHIDYSEDANRLVIINTKYDGWVEKLYLSKEGQRIKAGQLLMGIYSPKILSAKEEYITTYNTIKALLTSQGKSEKDIYKDKNLMAARKKLLFLDMSLGQIYNLEKKGVSGRLNYFFSPISGTIISKKVLQGEHIKAGQEVARIANLSKLWVFINIFEKDIPFVKKGQTVEIKTAAYADKIYKGKIDLIYPFLDPTTRDVKVRIIVNNYKKLLKPGMFTNVLVNYKLPGKQLVISESSIVYSGKKSYVFVSNGEGEFEVRPLVVLTTSKGRAVIKEGLEENDLVVTNGQFLLDSEASLKEALAKGQMAGHNH